MEKVSPSLPQLKWSPSPSTQELYTKNAAFPATPLPLHSPGFPWEVSNTLSLPNMSPLCASTFLLQLITFLKSYNYLCTYQSIIKQAEVTEIQPPLQEEDATAVT